MSESNILYTYASTIEGAEREVKKLNDKINEVFYYYRSTGINEGYEISINGKLPKAFYNKLDYNKYFVMVYGEELYKISVISGIFENIHRKLLENIAKHSEKELKQSFNSFLSETRDKINKTIINMY